MELDIPESISGGYGSRPEAEGTGPEVLTEEGSG
jgi:hypothetical protein